MYTLTIHPLLFVGLYFCELQEVIPSSHDAIMNRIMITIFTIFFMACEKKNFT